MPYPAVTPGKQEQPFIDPFADLEPSTPVLALLYGKVTDKQGNPIPDARVSVHSSHSLYSEWEVLAFSFTDEQGKYSFSNLPVASVRIMAAKPGYFLEYEYMIFSPRKLSLEKNLEMSKGGFSLKGTVQDKEGKPVHQAILLLHITESNLCLRETTNDRGEFRFEGLWNARANLSAIASGFTAWFQSPVPIGKEDMKIVLSREGGTRLKGHIYYEGSEETVPGAAVVVLRQNKKLQDNVTFIANADDKGYYETAALPSGKYNLWASKNSCNGFWGITKDFQLIEGSGEEAWMDLFLPERFDIRGCVLDAENGKPVPGAVVRVHGSVPIVVQTDSQGRFRIPNSEESRTQGQIYVTAYAPAYAESFQIIKVLSTKIPPLVFKLKKGIHVHGIVYSSTGEPVPNALWEIRPAHSSSNRMETNPATDSQGRYEKTLQINSLGRRFNIHAYSPKHGYGSLFITIPEQAQDIEHDITLSPGVTVTVLVMDEKGEGIRDCTVDAASQKREEFIFYNSFSTDVEGQAVFENLPKSPYRFSASHTSLNLKKEKSLDLTIAEGPQEIVFSLDEPENVLRLIHGTVTDEDGQSLKDAWVGIDEYSGVGVLTNAEGYYCIEVTSPQERSSDLISTKAGYATERKRFDRRQKNIQIDVVLKKQDDVIFFGNIVSRNGEIPTEAELQIVMKRENNDLWRMDFTRIGLKQGGGFEINLNPQYYKEGSHYFVQAHHPVLGSGRSQLIKAEGSRRVGPFEIDLSWGMLKGYVRDSQTGIIVGNVLLSTTEIRQENVMDSSRSQSDISVQTVADENGYFELSPLPCESLEIYFYHPDYWIQKRPSPEISRENLEMEWDPVLEPFASVEGTVFDSDGRHLENRDVSINCFETSYKIGQYYYHYIQTEERGHYSFRGIPPGDYVFALNMESYETNSIYSCHMERMITVSQPEQRVLDIHLPKRVPVILQMQHGEGIYFEPLYPADYKRLYLYFHTGSSDTGNVHSVLLPPGRYLLRSGRDDNFLKEIEITPTGENRITIEDKK